MFYFSLNSKLFFSLLNIRQFWLTSQVERRMNGIMDNTLKIEDITVVYGNTTVLRNFSMYVNRGESVAVTGASGCGKSSLLKAVIGISPIVSGIVSIGDNILDSHGAAMFRRHFAYLPQELTFPCERVCEVANILLRLKANKGKEHTERLLSYFERLGLHRDIYNKRLSEISGGQRQRVMIAVAALLQKDFMLLDEPTSALDRETSELVHDFLVNLEHKPGILAVTHDAAFSSKCNKVVNLSKNS